TTMDVRADVDLSSYDRFFPNQDYVPTGGFGNLIALPLQKKSRVRGNTEFVTPEDRELRPYLDQWTFLSGIKRLSSTQLATLLEQIPAITVGPGAAAVVSPLVRQKYPAPKQIRCVLGPTVSLEKSGIPPWIFLSSSIWPPYIILSSMSVRSYVSLLSKFQGLSDVMRKTSIISTCREEFWKIFER